jgi:hypothetical protein
MPLTQRQGQGQTTDEPTGDEQRSKRTTSTTSSSTEDAELPPEVAEAIQLLKRHARTHGDAIVSELKGTAVYQLAFNAGHSEGNRKGGDKLTKAQARVEELEAELEETRKGQPDVETLNAKWQRVLEKQKGETAEEREKRERAERRLVETRLEVELKDKLRPKYARLVAKEKAQRLRLTPDGTEEYLDETGSPMQVPKGKSVYDLAVTEAVSEADPEDVLSHATSGGGRTGGGAYRPQHDALKKTIEEKRAAGTSRASLF